MLKIGKYYVHEAEISYIKHESIKKFNENIEWYTIHMKNGEVLAVTEQEFEEFKVKCGCWILREK